MTTAPRVIVNISLRGDDISESVTSLEPIWKLLNAAIDEGVRSGAIQAHMVNWELSAMSAKRFQRMWQKEEADRGPRR